MNREKINELYDLLDYVYESLDYKEYSKKKLPQLSKKILDIDKISDLDITDLILIVQEVLRHDFLEVNKCWKINL